MSLTIVEREVWRAKAPNMPEDVDHNPKMPYGIVIDHYSYTKPCSTGDDCISAVQMMQEKDLSRGYNDIRFNFLIGGDGRIYEGRGWRVCASRTLKDVIKIWRRRLDILFIGDYTEIPVPDLMMQRFEALIFFGVREKLIERHPISYHVRKGIQVLPVEGTRDDFLGRALLKVEKLENEADEVWRDKKEREKAIKDRKEAEEIEEGKVVRKKSVEIPYSDCPCERHHKKAQEEKLHKEVEKQVKKGIRNIVF